MERSRGLKKYLVSLLGVCSFLLPGIALAAGYSWSPGTQTVGVGSEISAKILVDPGGQKINAVEGTIQFDKDLLSVSKISKDGSSFSLWTAEPSFSNTDGTIIFSGGSPTALETGGTVLTVTFKGKKEGSAVLSFSKGSILAADGKGTNVYESGQAASYTVSAAKQKPPEVEEVVESGEPSPAPTINSSSHAKTDGWYATSTAEFSWPSTDATSYRYEFSKEQSAQLTKTLKATESSIRFSDIPEGEMFFLLQYRNDAGWSELAVRRIQTDRTPPLDFDFSLDATGEKPLFVIEAKDELSGIGRYEILFGETIALTIKDQDVSKGSYSVPPQAGGKTLVTIKAYDKAGNVKAVEKELDLPLIEKASSKGSEPEPVPPPPSWTMERVLMVIFALAMGALTSWHIYGQKIADRERVGILQDVHALRERNDKVFQSMREEFEQMISDFDARPQLTPEERDFLEKVKEILDISSELVDSGIEDLKKTVRGKR